MTFELRLLGPLEVDGPAGAVALGGQKNRAVLALLALSAGRYVTTGTLLDGAWEVPPPSGARTLRSVLSRLRAALSDAGVDGSIEAAANSYALKVASGRIDLQEVLARAERARELRHDPAAAVAELRGALGMWRGPALEEFADLPALAAEGHRLAELRASLLEERLAAELTLGEDPGLVGELETLVAREPLRERWWELLITSLYGAGRQADALRAFQRCRSALAEAGLEPGPALVELDQRVATHTLEPVAGRSGRWSPAATTATPADPITPTADLASSATPAMPPTVMKVRTEAGSRRYPLVRPRVSLGSDPGSDVVIPDSAVSRTHARLEWTGSQWLLTDQGSRNGTFVNGHRIDAPHTLVSGDAVRVGRALIELETVPSSPQTETLPEPPTLAEPQQRLLMALCRPLLAGDLFDAPAGLAEVAEAVGVPVDQAAVELDRLAELLGAPGRSDRWAQLARTAVATGAVRPG